MSDIEEATLEGDKSAGAVNDQDMLTEGRHLICFLHRADSSI
jgi:hypothetical protein